ncbi:hypothetical protein ACWDV4_27410 [Micromonospora sp. NPDC003197]
MPEAIAANPAIADKIRDGRVVAAGALVGAIAKTIRVPAITGQRFRGASITVYAVTGPGKTDPMRVVLGTDTGYPLG